MYIEDSDIREIVFEKVCDTLFDMSDEELESIAKKHLDGYDEELDLTDVLLGGIDVFDLADMLGIDVEGIRCDALRQLFEERQDMMRLRASYEYSR